ncbi:serine hydrolase domain-containing protein [Nocardioides marinquilinus]|uniref:Serine hydrolase domain-containing protein n=1 Tax=Nocardioides marinquilinus TaxID=1210400 RepID=A0ABP9Q2N3_9ACTN
MTLHDRLVVLQRRGRLPSVVGGVVRDGVLVETAGVATDPEVAFRIGSITKTLTAVLVMQLRDEGRLGLDDPLARHLPGVGYGDLTLAGLLGHTGGMQSEPCGPWWERTDGGDFATLAAANDGSGAVAGPGEWFHYSNLGYGLLGEVVARLREAPWWDVVRTRLLEPLDLTRTTYGPVAPHAQGHSVEHLTGRLADEPHTDTGAMAPAGQAWSTVADLAVWAGVLAGRRPDVLAPATAEEMRRPRLDPGYGFGLRLVEAGGRRLAGHTGSMPGFLASLFTDPATGDAVIVLANATTGLDTDGAAAALLEGPEPAGSTAPWTPSTDVPDAVAPLLGFWFWGHTALELRWSEGRLEVRRLQDAGFAHAFELRADGAIVGVEGYHRGETLHVHPTHLECATFVYTRTPYDPAAPIPGA